VFCNANNKDVLCMYVQVYLYFLAFSLGLINCGKAGVLWLVPGILIH